eukprot:5012792-Amphidinium_carterae.1
MTLAPSLLRRAPNDACPQRKTIRRGPRGSRIAVWPRKQYGSTGRVTKPYMKAFSADLLQS